MTDYLNGLGNHVMGVLRKSLGLEMVRTSPLHFVLTVPAIWQEHERQRTMRAFERVACFSAGQSITMVSEPEAAATYTLSKLPRHDLRTGESFVVVDAGGGTVDLITYNITQREPFLEVEEAAEGSGGLCGSATLNMKFEEFLRAKLGQAAGFDMDVLRNAMETFENRVGLTKCSSRSASQLIADDFINGSGHRPNGWSPQSPSNCPMVATRLMFAASRTTRSLVSLADA